MKILLADDDRDQLAVRGMLLRQNGFEAIEASTLEESLEAAAEHQPPCAVVDLRMPTEKRGLELLHELKRLRPSIHLIVLTGIAADCSGRADLGIADEVISKGGGCRQLVARLKAVEMTSPDLKVSVPRQSVARDRNLV
jgi:DNA-binding response OmpR family regulator